MVGVCAGLCFEFGSPIDPEMLSTVFHSELYILKLNIALISNEDLSYHVKGPLAKWQVR